VTVTTGLPDFTGLTLAQALDLAQSAKVDLRAVGTGIAVLQDRQPGPVDSGSPVRVYFEPPT
jgi:cell division protein FtsI (penicillin-binding protein 3)